MSQAWKIVNLTKQEVLTPGCFGDGYQLRSLPLGRTIQAFTLLMAGKSNGDGGGDLPSSHEYHGRWHGDKIAFVGEYDDSHSNYSGYSDISQPALELLLSVSY